MKLHILVIDDSETAREAIASVLPKREYTVTMMSTGTEALSYLDEHPSDFIFLDDSLSDTDGLSLLHTLVKKFPDVPVVMVTESGSEKLAVNALKSGASDYLVKSSDFISKVPHIIRENLDKYEMKRRNRDLETQLRDSFKQLKQLNRELEEKVLERTEELERAYQLSNELMAKAVDSNMQLAELYTEVDESRRKLDLKIRELSLLNELAQEITSASDKDHLLRIVLDAVHEELAIDHCALLLLSEETQHLHIGMSFGTPDDLLLASHSLRGEQILLDVIRKNRPLLVQDVQSDADFAPLATDFPGIESFVLIPIRTKQKELGVCTAYGYEQNATLTQDDATFVLSLATQTALALVNLDETARRIQAEQFAMVGKAVSYLTGELDVAFSAMRQAIDPEIQPNASQRIEEEIAWIAGTLQECAEFAQGRHGTLSRQRCSVKEFLQKIQTKLTAQFSGQNIQTALEVESDCEWTIDAEKMRRVLLNFAENARQRMPNGGVFTIKSRQEGEKLLLTLTDTGSMLPLESQMPAFDASWTAESERQDIGFGMLIAKKILDEHEAALEVQSGKDQGTTCYLTFLPAR